LLILGFPGFSTVFSYAQGIDPSNMLFQYLTLENGLPHNKVNAVNMDREGFMWFGTNDGICRYDGFNLKNYALSRTIEDQIRTPQIGVIKTDSKGNLLIGTYSLFRYNYTMDRIERCDSSKETATMGRVYAIEEGIDGLMWIGTEKGLFSYNTGTDLLTAHPSHIKNELIIISLLVDGEKIWSGTRNNSLFVYDIRNNSFSTVPKFSLSKEVKDQVNCLYKDKKNVIWAGTQDNGIFKFNITDSSLKHVYPDAGNNMSYRIRKIMNDKYGNIWIGSRLGIFLQKAGTDSLILIKQIDPLPSKTRSNSIYDIFIDRNEIMWVGTFSFGVGYSDFRRKPFHLYNLSDEETLFSAKMINCFADDDDENIWVGTEENGLFCFNRNTLKFKQFKPEPKNNNSLAGENVKTIVRESDGNLWIGYYAGGVDYLQVKSGQLAHYKFQKNSVNSIASNSIRVLLLDEKENLFIGSDKGVDFLKKGSLTFLHLNLDIEVLTLYEDSENRIWAGTSGDGIYRLKRDSLEFEKVYPLYFTTSIKAIHVDSQANLWIGTNRGLYCVNSKNDSLLHFGMNNGLPSNIILDILEDNHQNLWVSTGAGLVKCEIEVTNPQNLIIKQFNVSDGLQGAQFRESASYKNSRGEFYFGGNQGFNIFEPDSIKSNPYPPRLAFTKLKIFNKDVEIGDKIKGRIVLDRAINQIKQLTLSYKHSPLSIEFAALHFSNPENNKYKFKLLPLEKEWNYSSGIRNFASYSNLQGGYYSFMVEAANNDGLWNSEPLILKIKVIPPFWKTWWFTGILILILSASVLGYYFYRISSLKQYNAELEKKVEDRTRKLKESFDQLLEKQNYIEEQSKLLKQQTDQLQELNSTKDKFFSIIAHDLRSPFQSLLGFSELLLEEMKETDKTEQKSYIRTIYDSTNHIYSLVENLLTWSLTQTNKITFVPEEIDVLSLMESVVALLQPNILQKNIIVEKVFKSDKKGYADKNMVDMVIRNLIANAIKFTSESGKIHISLTDNKNELLIEIRDNGVGISIEDQKKLFRIDSNYTKKGTKGEKGTGLGLIICKEFIEKNNGKIWVESIRGEGSSFFFTIPVLETLSH
jgi:ligand-binding sensor domain-containing protein/signal transduction histidine kinase